MANILTISLILLCQITMWKCSPLTEDNEIFYNLTRPELYNRFMPPHGQVPLQIKVSIHLFGSGNIYDPQKLFDLDILLRQSWFDERLRSPRANDSTNSTLSGGLWHLNRLWTPSLHIVNGRDPDLLHVAPKHPVLVRIQSDGLILSSQRIKLAGITAMDFRLYPLDMQKIRLEIESNEMPADQLELVWHEDDACSMADSFRFNGFSLINHRLMKSNTTYTHTGSFSRLDAVLFLRRQFYHIFLDVYAPISLFVMISFGSFWVEITAAPARVTLSVTIMLTMVTTARSAKEKLPSVSYIHALDIWILVCTIFVLGTILEYIMINYVYFGEKRSQSTRTIDKLEQTNNGSCRTNNTNDLEQNQTYFSKKAPSSFFGKFSAASGTRLAYQIDSYCRWIFPLLFLIYNLLHWTILYVLSASKEWNIFNDD